MFQILCLKGFQRFEKGNTKAITRSLRVQLEKRMPTSLRVKEYLSQRGLRLTIRLATKKFLLQRNDSNRISEK